MHGERGSRTYLVNTVAGHGLPGRDIKGGLAERVLTPFADHVPPSLVTPEDA